MTPAVRGLIEEPREARAGLATHLASSNHRLNIDTVAMAPKCFAVLSLICHDPAAMLARYALGAWQTPLIEQGNEML